MDIPTLWTEIWFLKLFDIYCRFAFNLFLKNMNVNEKSLSFNQKKKLIFNLSDIGIDNSAAYLIGKTVLKIFSSKHM